MPQFYAMHFVNTVISYRKHTSKPEKIFVIISDSKRSYLILTVFVSPLAQQWNCTRHAV